MEEINNSNGALCLRDIEERHENERSTRKNLQDEDNADPSKGRSDVPAGIEDGPYALPPKRSITKENKDSPPSKKPRVSASADNDAGTSSNRPGVSVTADIKPGPSSLLRRKNVARKSTCCLPIKHPEKLDVDLYAALRKASQDGTVWPVLWSISPTREILYSAYVTHKISLDQLQIIKYYADNIDLRNAGEVIVISDDDDDYCEEEKSEEEEGEVDEEEEEKGEVDEDEEEKGKVDEDEQGEVDEEEGEVNEEKDQIEEQPIIISDSSEDDSICED